MKLRIPLFAEFYDYTGAARQLERMAAKGWLLTDVGQWFWSFEKANPQKLHYTVVYFPDVSDLDPDPKIELLDYIAMCEEAGWKLAAQRHQMLIFCNEETNPVPIDTDPLIQVETIHKVMKKTHIRGHGVMMAIALLYLVRYVIDLNKYGVYFLADSFDLYLLMMWVMLFLGAAAEIVTYLLWLRRARGAAAVGSFVSAKRFPVLRMFEVTLSTVGMLLLLVFAADAVALLPMLILFAGIYLVIGGMNWFGKFLKKQGYDSGSNQIMQSGVMFAVLFVFFMLWATKTSDYVAEKRNEQAAGYVTDRYGDARYYNDHTLPLSLDSLGVTAGDATYDRSLEETASPLISIVSGCDRPVLYMEDEMENMPALSYTLYVAKVDWLNQYLKDWAMLRYLRFAAIRDERWQAEQVLKHVWEENYLVIWEDRVMEICFPYAPTDEQIRLVVETMKGGDFK
ncbi:MAG: DUF2812 domain-containing protein [Oscillospiraceae bacterium]|nr:DUF2812 domain-containing protein [Oscillospiraceae bacterium]